MAHARCTLPTTMKLATPSLMAVASLAATLVVLGGRVPSMQIPELGRTRVDVAKLGPQVGERVPDFDLKDQNGKSWTLRSSMGPKGAMLVFFRSADW